MFTNILKPTNPQLAAPHTTSIFENSLFPTCMVLIHIALYVMVGMVLNISLSNPSTDELTFSGGMSLNLLREGQLWRAVSSVFSHAGWNHLIGNMIGLWSLLRVLSSSCNRKTLVEIYLLSAVLSNLISLFFLPPAVIVVGASGGVFGLAGFLVLQITKAKIDKASLGKWDGVGIILSLTKSLFIGFTLPQVNNAAHVAGFCVGLAVWFFLSKNINFHVDSKLRIVFLLGVISLSTGFALNQNAYLNLNKGKMNLLPSEMAQVAVQFRNEIDKFLEDVKSSKGESDADDQIRIRWGRARPQLESLNKKFIELTNESNLSFNLRSFAGAIQLNMSSQLELMDAAWI